MQGKEAFEQETKIKCSVGIDVGKAWLDVHVLPTGESRRLANTPEGIGSLKRWLVKLDLALVAIGATGKWRRPLNRSLQAEAMPVAIVDPFRVRMFARAQGIAAKTDRLDARVLARFASLIKPERRPPGPEAMAELAEPVKARDSAVAEASAPNNRLCAAATACLKRRLERRIREIAKHIAALEKEIQKRLKAGASLARRHHILASIIGFGPAAASVPIACLPELGSLSRREIAVPAGLAPIADDCGGRHGVGVIWGGRAAVRRVLYLAALPASRHAPGMKAFVERLTAKAALIALARKPVVLANTPIAHGRTYQLEAPKHA